MEQQYSNPALKNYECDGQIELLDYLEETEEENAPSKTE